MSHSNHTAAYYVKDESLQMFSCLKFGPFSASSSTSITLQTLPLLIFLSSFMSVKSRKFSITWMPGC